MKTLLMQIHTSDTEGCTDGIDFALVHIDEELAGKILERRELLLQAKSKDDIMLRIHYSDSNCHFLRMTKTVEEVMRKYVDSDDTGFALVPDYTMLVPEISDEDWAKIEKEGTAEVDCDEMIISPDGVYWVTFLADLDDIRISSGTVNYEMIEQCISTAVHAH